jgi:hypothetical protein
MADKKISELTLGTPAEDDVIPFTDVSGGVTLKALKSALKGDKGDKGDTGSAGADGDDSYVYIAYASANDGTGFTLTFNSALDYIAIKNTTTAIVSPQASDFAGLWKNYKGVTGASGLDGASVESVSFVGDDMVFVLTDASTVTLVGAKTSLKGDTGSAGANGTNGTDGTDGISYIWKGTYDAGTTYSANDCVAYQGTSYIWINATPGSGQTPADNTYWDILALKGTDGAGSGDMLLGTAQTVTAAKTFNAGTLKVGEDVAITATATELNVLDGIPATLTATELGYVDGVTSAIQTQLGTKVIAPATNSASYIPQWDTTANSKTLLEGVAMPAGGLAGLTALGGKVDKATYDAHTVLYATTDNNPVALTVGEQTLVGRATGGNISAIAIDSDLSSVSASDDTVPSAKATKAMGDLKLPLAGGTMTGKTVTAGSSEVGKTYTPAGTGARTVALDGALNNIHLVNCHVDGSALTFTVANITNSQVFIVIIKQGASTASTITAWFNTISWSGGSAPTLSTGLGKTDTFGFVRSGADTYLGFVIGQNA